MSFWSYQIREAILQGKLRLPKQLDNPKPQLINPKHGIYPVDQILAQVGSGRVFLDGHWVRVGRFEVFKKRGIHCVSCGLKGEFFRKEKSTDPSKTYILNLYGIGRNNQLVLMTKDHIIPKSKGGMKTLDNLQPMCAPCNIKKADKIILDNGQII